MSGWLHGIAWSQSLGIICIWYGMKKTSRSPGSVYPVTCTTRTEENLTLRYKSIAPQLRSHDVCGQRALSEIGHG